MRTLQHKSLIFPSAGFHICLLCILTAEKGTKFEFTPEQQCCKSTRLQAVFLREKWDFSNGYICTVSPCVKYEKASIIMFSILRHAVGRHSFCLCVDSPFRGALGGSNPSCNLQLHIWDHIKWQGKPLAAAAHRHAASDNHILSEMPKCYRKIHRRSR